MYRYHLEGRSRTIPGRIIRLTVTAANADDARRMAQIRCPDFGQTVRSPKRRGQVIEVNFASDQSLRCRFCHRYVIDGLYTRVSFPDGVANVCDNCHEKRDEPNEVEWRGAFVEVTD